LVSVLNLQLGKVSYHGRADLVRELHPGVDLLLLELKLLLLALKGDLAGLDFLLLFLQASLDILVAPSAD
jgi:hypothetical protein